MLTKSIIRCACACLAIVSTNVYSATHTSNATNQGWYNSSGVGAINSNYLTGEIYRNWFAFDLGSINMQAGESIVGASLTVTKGGFTGGGLTKTWLLTSIETDISTLTTVHSSVSAAGEQIFEDLADGTAYGSKTVTNDTPPAAAPVSPQVVADLSSAALAAIETSLGSMFAIGGYLSDAEVLEGGVIFNGTGAAPMAELTIETSMVPVPAAAWLFASGLFTLIGISRKR